MKRTVLLISLVLCVGCMRDEACPGGSELTFDAALREMTPGVKSMEKEILNDGKFSVSMCGERLLDGVAAKAAATSAVPGEIRAFGYRYRSPWKGSETPGLMDGGVLRSSSGRWSSLEPMLTGPAGTGLSIRFYAYAPSDVPGLETIATSGGPVLEYIVPEDVANQQDILFGHSGEYPASSSDVRLDMRHILSAVTFAVDDECSDCTVTGVSLKGINCSARYSDTGGWTGHGNVSDRGITLNADVKEGTAQSISGGAATLMLIPQTLPEGAVLQITVEKEGERFSLDAPIAGCVWEEGCTYVYRLSFTVNLWDSTFTYRIDMGHYAGLVMANSPNLHLPAMYFKDGTEMISVDWGDGTVSEYTSSPGTGMRHGFSSGYEGNVIVKVRGSSPTITMQGGYVQCISGVSIEGSELYDSRDGCNCIIDTATGDLVYAGIDYKIPSCVRTIRQHALCTIEDRTLVIPEGVRCLRYEASSYNGYYTKYVTIPSTLTSIADGAFLSNRLVKATVDGANPVYDSRGGCIMETATDLIVVGTENMTIPEETKGARPYSCQCSPKYTVTLPSSCTDLKEYSFANNGYINTISIPAGAVINTRAFYGSGMSSVEVPEGCSVGYESFGRCYNLTSASLHCPVIQDRTFYGCSKLATLDLWDGFSAQKTHVFQNCALSEIRCHCSTPPTVGGFDLGGSGTLHIPAGADWSEWIEQLGFEEMGWTIVKDL